MTHCASRTCPDPAPLGGLVSGAVAEAQLEKSRAAKRSGKTPMGRFGRWAPPVRQRAWARLLALRYVLAVGVYIMLASRCKKGSNKCWASRVELSRELGADHRAIQRALAVLERPRLVLRTGTAYRGTSMTFRVAGLVWPPFKKGERGVVDVRLSPREREVLNVRLSPERTPSPARKDPHLTQERVVVDGSKGGLQTSTRTVPRGHPQGVPRGDSYAAGSPPAPLESPAAAGGNSTEPKQPVNGTTAPPPDPAAARLAFMRLVGLGAGEVDDRLKRLSEVATGGRA